MTAFARPWTPSVSVPLALLVMALCGCATTTSTKASLQPKGVPAPAAASSDLEDPDLSAAMGLLYKGDAVAARKRLIHLLTRRPNDPTARSLVRQIDTPPEALLGSESFAYVTRPDDSLSLLAERFLGDPVLFYALARYNHIATPGVLAPGQTLRIPGHEKPEAARPPHANTEPRPAAPATKPAEQQHPAPEAPAPPALDPRRASQLRAAGLEQLNRGAIDRAVSLLQEAHRLDPKNPLIQHDLDRAQRISRAVHAKP